MFNNLKSSIQQAFFDSLEQAGCLQLETVGPEEDSDSGSEASDEESDDEVASRDGEAEDMDEEEDDEEGEDDDDEEEETAEASGRAAADSRTADAVRSKAGHESFVDIDLESSHVSGAGSDVNNPFLQKVASSGAGQNPTGPSAPQ